MKFKKISLLLLIFLISFCSQQTKKDKNPIEIVDIKNAFENKYPINITDIADDYNYIVLESGPENLISGYFKIFVDDQYLIAISRHKILLFDRESGKFIREIGTPGRGPDEYMVTYPSMAYDEDKKLLYAKGSHERFEYTLDGRLKNRKKAPAFAFYFVNLNENNYASFNDNGMGNETKKIIIYNERDSIIKIFPNYQSYPFKGIFVSFYPDSWFYKLHDKLYFIEKFSDTLFALTPNSLVPRFVFEKGSYSFPYELRGDYINLENDYFLTTNILESAKYLFYVFTFKSIAYTAVYDKKLEKTTVNDYSEKGWKGYINNISDFVPLEISSINDKGELICTIEAYKIKLWFNNNATKSEQLPEYLKKLKNITETDNPVVMIARLKE